MPSSEGIFFSAYTEYCRNRVLCTYNFFIIIKSATSRLSGGHKTRPYGRTVCCASPEVISSILVSTYFQRHHIHLLALLCCDYLFLIMVLLQRTVHTPLPCCPAVISGDAMNILTVQMMCMKKGGRGSCFSRPY